MYRTNGVIPTIKVAAALMERATHDPSATAKMAYLNQAALRLGGCSEANALVDELTAVVARNIENLRKVIAPVAPKIISDVIVPSRPVPNASLWKSLHGLRKAKRELYNLTVLPGFIAAASFSAELVIPAASPMSPERLRSSLSSAGAVLLHGPCGSGKSTLARAVAEMAGWNMVTISCADVLSKWMGESEQRLRQFFDDADSSRPCLLFIDELDSLGSHRGKSETSTGIDRVTTELLMGLSRMSTGSIEDDRVVVAAATNHPWNLDRALVRRFSNKIFVGYFTEKETRTFLELRFGDPDVITCSCKTCPEVSQRDVMDKLIFDLMVFSPAELEKIIGCTLQEPYEELLDKAQSGSGDKTPMALGDVLENLGEDDLDIRCPSYCDLRRKASKTISVYKSRKEMDEMYIDWNK